MPLTDAEKKAGRAFRDQCSIVLAQQDPADAFCSPYIVWYRHPCKPSERTVQGSTWAMKLRQYYWLSPAYPGIEAGKFAFIFRRGECSRCGTVVRSNSWRFVLAADNPPEKGAVIGYQQPEGASVR